MAKITAVGQVKKAVGHAADTVGKTKNGTVMVRKGYFYRCGSTASSVAARISTLLTEAGVAHRIEDSGDHWAPFVGKGSVARNSHFYVEITVFGE
jgi:hypothetical protein